MRASWLLTMSILLSSCLPAWATSDYIDIEKRLTPAQMQATGLDTLSAEQLRALNALLGEETRAVIEAAREEGDPRVTGTSSDGDGRTPISSALAGDLRGWSRGTVLTLENGQRWRVIDGEYYAGKPLSGEKVTVSPGKISGWYLQVEGHNPRPKVQRAD